MVDAFRDGVVDRFVLCPEALPDFPTLSVPLSEFFKRPAKNASPPKPLRRGRRPSSSGQKRP
jgi:hypothetical protein